MSGAVTRSSFTGALDLLGVVMPRAPGPAFLSVWSLLFLLACGATPPTAAADGALTLPSGVAVKRSSEWRHTLLDDGARLEGPEGKLAIELVEVREAADLQAAITIAWSRRRPDFARAQKAASDAPGRDGWEQMRWAVYETSPEESRKVSAIALRQGQLAIVMLTDAPAAAIQRRVSQWLLIRDSLRPPGHQPETYAGRTPRALTEADAAELTGLVERAMKAADVPGVAVAIFDAKRSVLERGFGVRRRGELEPVDADTLFLVASDTKPLTSLLLAKLVDQGRFTWQTPVLEVFPSFALGDAAATARLRIEHLLCACTGLPRQDHEWVFTTSSPEAQLALLATMTPTTEFGALFQYSNPLAAAGGYIAGHAVHPEAALGPAYDAAMRELVFEPLGMTSTTFDFDAAARGNHAAAHSWDLSLRTVPTRTAINRSIVPVRPAGGAWSNLRDMTRYVRLELSDGLLPAGTRYISEEALHARRSPQVRVRESAWYGIGLWLTDVKGVRVINHGGSMFGFRSDFFFVPEAGVGGVVLTNADSGWPLIDAVKRRTLELVYGGTPEAEEDMKSEVAQALTGLKASQAAWAVPPEGAAVARLAGRYRNGVLGDFTVHREGDQAVFRFGRWGSPVATNENSDGTMTFVTTEPGIRGLEFTAPDASGPIHRLVIRDAQHEYVFDAVVSRALNGPQRPLRFSWSTRE